MVLIMHFFSHENSMVLQKRSNKRKGLFSIPPLSIEVAGESSPSQFFERKVFSSLFCHSLSSLFCIFAGAWSGLVSPNVWSLSVVLLPIVFCSLKLWTTTSTNGRHPEREKETSTFLYCKKCPYNMTHTVLSTAIVGHSRRSWNTFFVSLIDQITHCDIHL